MEMIKKLCIRSESLMATNIASISDMKGDRAIANWFTSFNWLA
jgi:hypothetical protein